VNGRVAADSWRDLESETPAYGTLSAHGMADSDVVLAVDHEGRHHLLLPISAVDEGFTDRRSRGIIVAPRLLEVEQQPARPFLDVCCSDRTANEAFNLVANGLLDELEQRVPTVDAVQTALARWRRFWGTVPVEGLDPEETRGLFGELWFLLVWLLPHGPAAVEHWLGPSGSRNDFQWPGVAVEVKATMSVRGHVHRINGIDQLDAPENGALLLFSLRIREEPSSSNSLVTLVERIEQVLADEPERLDLFEGRLAGAGYSAAHDERYRDARYRVLDERLYRVSDDFPRLSIDSFRSGLPVGIERIEYETNLEGFAHLVTAAAPADFTPPER
jgi:Putative  PD-(D/E)XK family member, (DUF4420)